MAKKEAMAKAAVNKVKEDVPARKRKASKYKSFRLQKKIPHPAGPLPSVRVLLRKTRKLIVANWKPLLGIFIIYTLLNLALVRNFTSPLDVAEVKDSLRTAFGTQVNSTATFTTVLGLLFGSTTSAPTENSGSFQTILLIVVSLALIWVFRQYAAGNKPTARMAFYRGMYPLVPFLLVLLVMTAQLLPAVAGGVIFGIVSDSQLAISGFEQGLWILFYGLLVLLSLYMLCSSIFALYISTLPEMTPMAALRTARQLVFSRRFNVAKKILVLPVLILITMFLIVIPALYFISGIAPWLYFALTILSVIFLHAYMFVIYRELL
jgi:hypothetical protein